MNSVSKAAARFGTNILSIQPVHVGLIHDTYIVRYSNSPAIILQCINQHSFAQPENIILNYRKMTGYLAESPAAINIPAMVPTHDGQYFFRDENMEDETVRFWRATAYVENCYSVSTLSSPGLAATAAGAYARFTCSLEGLDPSGWNQVIAGFHDLSLRYRQFEQSTHEARLFRLMKATHIIATLREKYHYVEWFEQVSKDEENYPTRFLHHDCKLNNILFDTDSDNVVAVVDLDTVMPGKYFSDLGDMIRTMACTEDEESRNWESIDINPMLYDAIVNGYVSAMEGRLTPAEMAHLKEAGILVTYMQALRYTADYLNNDLYYKTNSPDHNLYRAFNQLILLEKLEALP